MASMACRVIIASHQYAAAGMAAIQLAAMYVSQRILVGGGRGFNSNGCQPAMAQPHAANGPHWLAREAD